ncbi:hypothetical protein [Actinacidiphila acididurans]|uniref:Cupin domain-containing protein n=1 Tax=Actinacidiphila acididurans TaxID=2784346 RepID=A0ABS2TUT2_9ACTN|nr:hypothetical protein [Actinacidiphila acididurans]MBM9507092.1 hypothetical protein [Actinacidiphila acididurans]
MHSHDQEQPGSPRPPARTLCPPVGYGDGDPSAAAAWDCAWFPLDRGATVTRPASPVRGWLVALAGRCVLRIGEDTVLARPGDTFEIPADTACELSAPGAVPAQLLDVVEAPGGAAARGPHS